jgi:hypothetical protein
MAELGARYGIPAERMSFDKLGIGGNFPNHLAKYGLAKARPYAGSGRPMDPATFGNLRTEAAWRLRNRLDQQYAADMRRPHLMQVPFTFAPGSYLARLRDEIKPLTYECYGNVVKLMDKEDWAIILGHSPDVADALIQSFSW